MSEIENCECAVSDDDEPLLPSNVGHYKLLNLETSIFGPGLFCIRMIGLVFFLITEVKVQRRRVDDLHCCRLHNGQILYQTRQLLCFLFYLTYLYSD